MKSSKNLLEQLKILPFFDKNTVLSLAEPLKIGKSTVDTYISRYLGRKDLIGLKNGMYVSSEFFSANKGDASYIFYLANIIYSPSYVSSWSALQHYGMTTESIYGTTSMALKTSRRYLVKPIGDFSYRSIRRDLFTGFSMEKGRFEYFIASPAKALFDLLYFRTNGLRGIGPADALRLAEDLRVDIDEMGAEEKDKFIELIKNYERKNHRRA
jgi:predicted transcriptional regulator of viral defense system